MSYPTYETLPRMVWNGTEWVEDRTHIGFNA